MLDEFDDDLEVEEVPNSGEHRVVEPAVRPRVARLVSRLYGAAGAPLRTRMLACLVQPLGSLGLVAVASGAFAQLLYRRGDAGVGIPIGDLAGYSNDQIFELARFVEQLSPTRSSKWPAFWLTTRLVSARSAQRSRYCLCAP